MKYTLDKVPTKGLTVDPIMEISTNMYCSANDYEEGKCLIKGICSNCECFHRKWPTPEQFREEYGKEYLDEDAVYVLLHGIREWAIYDYGTAKRFNEKVEPVVCACTPWGKPPKNWRPE